MMKNLYDDVDWLEPLQHHEIIAYLCFVFWHVLVTMIALVEKKIGIATAEKTMMSGPS